jgi:phosphotransferase system enzyme I (PtsP)
MLEQAIQQLHNEGLPVTRPPVGAMIEVPAAVYQVEALARRVDFLSVGTNDLAQYLLATDRNNPHDSAHLYPVHPALLRALKQIRDSAWRTGTPVTICGEIAGEPAIALLLLGMGFDGLSMSPAALPGVKWAVRHVTSARMRALALESLQCERPEEVQRLLETLNVETGVEAPAPESAHHHAWMHRDQAVAAVE